ncbi:MAG: repeat protein [Segetibacter sp.]|nr:repeat protein [Segetibacter sp.]
MIYKIAFALACVTLFIVACTYAYLYKNKKRFFFRKGVTESLETWITQVILGDTLEKLDEFKIPDEFERLLFNPTARQVMIEELVRHKKSFSGNLSKNIIRLYYQIGLNVDSINKLDDKRPHIRCQGIHELYMMEQTSELHKLYKYTNSINKDVRAEAQTAVVQWFGFKGLRFLNVISVPLTEFQQIQLLELLRNIPFTGLPDLNKWLGSPNDTVVIFALKLAEHYKQSQVHNNVASCLRHKNEAVRLQAVKTLVKIGGPSITVLLIEIYPSETLSNRLNILDKLKHVATEKEIDFLIEQLHQPNELLQIAAATALGHSSQQGWELLQLKSFEEPKIYKTIYLHVKALLKK